MMAASNRRAGSNRPRVLSTRSISNMLRMRPPRAALDLRFADAWQDALDPELPAEPAHGVRHANARLFGTRPDAHKLILMGVVLGAGLQALGYFGAAYLF